MATKSDAAAQHDSPRCPLRARDPELAYGRSQSNSWADENSADMAGIRHAYEAGYSADGLACALEKMRDRDVRDFGNSALSGSETHPPLNERIVRVRRLTASMLAHGISGPRPAVLKSAPAAPVEAPKRSSGSMWDR